MTTKRWQRAAPAGLAAVVAAVVLGPLLGPGLVQRYDMVWSPLARWTPFVLGVGTPAPRAVPSDAVAVLVGRVVGPDGAQALILFASLMALGWGSAALLGEIRPGCGTLPRCATVVVAVWNPYVAERLAVGQWTVLVGAAALPLLLRAAVRLRRGTSGITAVLPGLIVASAAGSNAVVVALPPLVLAFLFPRPRWGAAAASVGLTALLSAAWLVPAILARPTAAAASVDAFRPVSDSALGAVGSLLGGGGFWNPASHLAERQGSVVVAAGGAALMVAGMAILAIRQMDDPGQRPIIWAASVCFLVVLMSVTPVINQGWEAMVTQLPGGGLLRDPQKLLGVWVVAAAVGVGAGADALTRREGLTELGRVVSVLLALAPVCLLPSMARGLSGALEPTRVPAQYLAAVQALDRVAGNGPVGILPWSQYRRYPWNTDRISLTLGPRLVQSRVLFDDSLPLRNQLIPGEDPRAARVSAAVVTGRDIGDALRAEGVRFVLVETSTGQAVQARALGAVVVDGPYAKVVDLGRPAAVPPPDLTALVVGWLLTGFGLAVTCATPFVGAAKGGISRLLQFGA